MITHFKGNKSHILYHSKIIRFIFYVSTYASIIHQSKPINGNKLYLCVKL